MKKSATMLMMLFGLVLADQLSNQSAIAQTNTYTSAVSGKWEVATNWSLGAPDDMNPIQMSNSGIKSVTIDATTSGSFTNTMTIPDIILTAPMNSYNILGLINAGTNVPLNVVGHMEVDANGELDVTNSALQVGLQGSLDLDIGGPGGGTMNLYSGSVRVGGNVNIANSPTSQGTLNIDGGDFTIVGGALEVGTGGAQAFGTVTMNGGTLNMNGSGMILGLDGTGTFNMTGGTAQAAEVTIGNSGGSQGIMNISGGNLSINQFVIVGNQFGSGLCSLFISSNATVNITNITQTGVMNVATNGTLTLSGGSMNVDKIILTNGGLFSQLGGALLTTQPFNVDNGSRFNIAGALNTARNFTVGATAGNISIVVVTNGGFLNITNAALGIGNDGTMSGGTGIGVFTVDNATVNAGTIMMGSTAGGQGMLSIQNNAVVNVASDFTASSGSMATTTMVTVTAGSSLNVPNGTISIGLTGSGLLNVAGTVVATTINLGGIASSGTLHLTSGSVQLDGLSANDGIVDGGILDVSAGSIFIGQGHNAAIHVNNGVARGGTMYIGYSPGFTGTFTQTGGTMNVSTNVIVGDCVSNAVGVATMSGGVLSITNAAHNAVLDVRNGTFTLNAGATLVVDTLIVTNSCGHFVNLGGTLVQNNLPILTPALDADGDGQSNGAEVAAGTDPLNPASTFHILSIVPTNGNNIRIDWTTVGSHSYVVQTNGNLNGGTFHDLSAAITVPGTNMGTTNYIHTNGAANFTNFYRVRLGP